MAFKLFDRIHETSTSTGTGDFTLSGAVTGFKTFGSRYSTGDTFYYAIHEVDGVGVPSGAWEVGLGTYSAANTLTRTTVIASSNSDAAVSFSAGNKRVFVTMAAIQATNWTVGGSATQVQYNNAGAFAGSSSFIWDESTKSLKVRGSIGAFRDDGTQADISATTYGVNGGGILHGRMANGTYASPTAILSGDIFGGFGCRAYHSGGAFQTSSPTSIHWVASENQTGSAYGSYLRILTTPKGATTREERVIVSDSGTLWCHDTGTFDPKVAAQTKPVSDVLILASGSASSSSGVFCYGTSLSAGFRGGNATGTPASPGATSTDAILCFMGGHVHDGTNWTAGTKALITFRSAQAITGSNQGTHITFETTPLNSTTRAEGARLDPDGNFLIQQAGKGLRVKEGSNAKQGTATLVAGAATVSNTSVTANSRIFLTSQADGGTPGWLRVSARTASTSFTITSSSGTDTSTVAYQIFEPA